MRLVMKAYKYKLYNSKKNKYLVHQELMKLYQQKVSAAQSK